MNKKQPDKIRRLLVSFSGGRTSAFMLWWLMNKWPGRHEVEIKVVFANTGKEDEKTLQFVKDVQDKWGIPIQWVEYRPGPGKGWASNPAEVKFETASRNGEPFEMMIAKLGIPSSAAPFCSTVLKKRTILAYMRRIGWRKFHTAIGIRNDEIDRMSENFRKDRLVYPLISWWPMTKPEILNWWFRRRFNLEVPEGLGNCDNCWKKDFLTLAKNARAYPEKFSWWQQMTDQYGHHNPRKWGLKPPFNFYRGNMSPKEIFEISKWSDEEITTKAVKEYLNSCSESCEAF